MWFGSQEGLNRFDGKDFVVYGNNQKNPEMSIYGSDVFDMAIDETGEVLWVLCGDGGLNKINLQNSKVEKKVVVVKNRSDDFNRSIALSGKYAYIGTQAGTVYKLDLEKYAASEIHMKVPGHNKVSIKKIYVDKFSNVWLLTYNAGVVVFDNQGNTLLNFEPERFSKKGFAINDFVVTGSIMWLVTSAGLKAIDLVGRNIIATNNLFSGNVQFSVDDELQAIYSSGTFLYTSGPKRLWQINTSSMTVVEIIFDKHYEDRQWLLYTSSIFVEEDEVWVGSQYGVALIKKIQSPFTGFYSSMDGADLKIKYLMALCTYKDSSVVACADEGIYSINHFTGVISKFQTSNAFYTIGEIESGLFLASGPKGLEFFNADGKLVKTPSRHNCLDSIASDVLISIQNIDSLVFMAALRSKGLRVWNKKQNTVHTINTQSAGGKLQSNALKMLYVDSNKKLWIVCNNAVSVYDIKTKSIDHLNLAHPQTNEPIGVNMDVCEIGDEFLLAAYGTGIVHLDKSKNIKRIYDFRNGFNSLGFYKIFRISDSLAIASTNAGLSVLNYKTGEVVNYFEEDGIHSNNFEQNSGTKKGKFIFLGGINGLTRVDLSKFKFREFFPRLFYTEVQVKTQNRTKVIKNNILEREDISKNRLETIVKFTAIDYSNPHKINFQYRIPSRSDVWISLGTQRFVSFIDFPPGTHVLEVRASNELGNWSAPIKLSLHFEPKWYQTIWFKFLLLLAIGTVIYSIYKYRINQIRKEERIRQRISSDLHDDIGSTLNSIKVYANLALTQPEKTEYLVTVKQNTQEAISGLRDVIWVLDDKEDSIEQLSARVVQFAHPLCRANDIEFSKTINPDLYGVRLGKEQKRNIYLTLKESINNSIKYAACTRIDFIILREGQQINFIIKDNGKGFDTTKPSHGNGLKNIHFRAKQAGYKAFIQSTPGLGTTITLTK